MIGPFAFELIMRQHIIAGGYDGAKPNHLMTRIQKRRRGIIHFEYTPLSLSQRPATEPHL
jgi:hypothetical protein